MFATFIILLLPGMENIANNQTPLFVILLCVMRSAISEAGRFIILSRTHLTYPNLGTPMMFAAGVATTCSLLLVTGVYFQNLTVSMAINENGLHTLLENANEQQAAFLEMVEPLFTTPAAHYIATSLDLPLLFVVHAACSLVLFAVIAGRAPKKYIFFTAALRLLYELPKGFQFLGESQDSTNAAYSALSNIYVSLAVSALAAGCLAYLAWFATKTYMKESLAQLRNDTERAKAFPNFNTNPQK